VANKVERSETISEISKEQWLDIYNSDEIIQKYRKLGDVEKHNQRLIELAEKYNYKLST